MTNSPKNQTLVRLQARGGTHAAIAWGLRFPDDGFSDFFGNDALLVRLAQALEKEDDEAQTVIEEGGRSVPAHHLAQWLPAMALRLKDEPFGPQPLELRAADPTSDGTIQCGVEESCPGGGNESLVQVDLDPAECGVTTQLSNGSDR